MKVSGRDTRGMAFSEDTSCENLCRSGVAFLTRLDVAIGTDVEIRIPQGRQMARRQEADFSTRGRIVHVAEAAAGGKLVGVQFTGPRFQKVFRSESAA